MQNKTVSERHGPDGSVSRVMVIGDVVGKPGRRILGRCLPDLIAEESLDFVIANGENTAAGFGLSKKLRNEIVNAGVDVITGGNHIWDRKEIYEFIDDDPAIVRPFNYPADVPGQGYAVYRMRNGYKIGVINLVGRVYNLTVDCPFKGASRAVEFIKTTGVKTIIVDFHAEATSEKKALGWFLDGRASAVIGTHTHIQTADEQVLPEGTAYITDAGMTGGHDSVIGMKKEASLKHFITMLPVRFEPAKANPRLNAVIIEIDNELGSARSITRINRSVP